MAESSKSSEIRRRMARYPLDEGSEILVCDIFAETAYGLLGSPPKYRSLSTLRRIH
jgi:hypothetical protein